MSNPIIRLEALKQFVRNLILPLSEDVSGLKDSVPSFADKQNWDSAKTHADSAHARTDATKVEKSTTNGNILVNSSETNVYSHPTTAGNKHIPAGGSSGQILRWSANGTAVWGDDKDTTYANMSAATTSAAGKAGLAPAPPAGAQGKYLRGDGTWQIPTNTTYSLATQSNNGLMSANDKKKLDKINTNNIVYATCATAANEQVKTIVLDDSNDTLKDGDIIYIKFSNTNTFSATTDKKITFKIGTDTFAIWKNGTDALTGTYASAFGVANRYHWYLVDKTNKKLTWLNQSNDDNTTYTNASLGQGYGTCSTAAATAAKVVSLSGYTLAVGGYVSVKFTYDVPANATLNINSKGAKAVYYKGAAIKAGTIKAGDIATFIYVNSQYHLINIDKQIDTRLSVENGKVYIEYSE